MKQPITLWYRLNDKKVWEYNHYFEGHETNPKHPRSRHPDHDRSWKNGQWGFALAYMENSIVVDVGTISACVK